MVVISHFPTLYKVQRHNSTFLQLVFTKVTKLSGLLCQINSARLTRLPALCIIFMRKRNTALFPFVLSQSLIRYSCFRYIIIRIYFCPQFRPVEYQIDWVFLHPCKKITSYMMKEKKTLIKNDHISDINLLVLKR